MEITREQIADRLTTMHNLYGKGDIIEIKMYHATNIEPGQSGSFTGFVDAKKQYGFSKRKFMVIKNTLFYCGHQSNLQKPYRY
jgi:hypothetical protein